jgi:hypothetical protein
MLKLDEMEAGIILNSTMTRKSHCSQEAKSLPVVWNSHLLGRADVALIRFMSNIQKYVAVIQLIVNYP